mmetsp:Transcript_9622/g.21001  ORF Transcript_9622/g.21001 Transcript_9622/m.21001 type:complete len:85 (-) Transcript_9622:789-1043(-)
MLPTFTYIHVPPDPPPPQPALPAGTKHQGTFLGTPLARRARGRRRVRLLTVDFVVFIISLFVTRGACTACIAHSDSRLVAHLEA